MRCPKCGSFNYMTIDSREDENTRHRRRKCLDCEFRWSTKEMELSRYNRLVKLEAAAFEFVKGE